MKLLSVIIPVFNAEKYLLQCVNSVRNQTYKDLEIILINDGSTDDSLKICQELSLKDERIRLINQANAGGGTARNVGLNLAKGEFIAFVDSDDYISPYMYEIMLKYMNADIDIVECSYTNVYSDDYFEMNKINSNILFEQYDASMAMEEHLKDTKFRQLIWNKVFRKSVTKEVRFPEGKGIDDEFWTYKAIGNSRKLSIINAVLYAYRQQENSVMHTINADNRIRTVIAKVERHEYIKRNYPELVALSNQVLWFTAVYCGQLVYLDCEIADKKKELNDIKKIVKLYPISTSGMKLLQPKQRIWMWLAKLNFNLTCRIRSILGIGM